MTERKPGKNETAEEMATRLATQLSARLPKENDKKDDSKENSGEKSEQPEKEASRDDASDEQDEEENEGGEIVHHEHEASYGGRMITEDVEDSTSLWLITFTDTMALMLTFFVLLYAMSIPKEDDWNQLTGAVQRQFSTFSSQAFNAGSQDTIEIEKLDYSRALDLGYLRSLLQDQINQEERLSNVEMIQLNDRLVVSLPSDLLFEPGKAEMGRDGRRSLFVIGGTLSRIRNKIEVVGHSDPTPVREGADYDSNWALSLARASSAAAVLENVGYSRDIVVKGLSSARYDELSRQIEEERRQSLSRRVDIVVLKDDGSKRGFLSVQ